ISDDPANSNKFSWTSALLRGKLYIFGGLNAGPSQSMWMLDVRKKRWRPVHVSNGNPPAPRHGHTMTCEALQL
ncbi:unnamed protein product, partial [Discosporangium mesarthrocarpum]